MGMVWVARLADAVKTAEIMGNPESVFDFIDPGSESDLVTAVADMIDLNKEWHTTHRAFTGGADQTDGPLSLSLRSHTEVGPDNGDGPAYYISPLQLQSFQVALLPCDDDQLQTKYNPENMVLQNVCLADAVQDEDEEGLE